MQDGIEMWWIEHVVCFFFEHTYGRWYLKLFALTFGTLWAMVAMVIGCPLLIWAAGREMWQLMGQS